MAKSKSKSRLKGLLVKVVVLGGLIFGGWYLYQNPQRIPSAAQDVLIEYNVLPTQTSLSSAAAQSGNSILGKTTSLVEESLQNLKVPKQFTGKEEIDMQEVVDSFTAKVQNLPTEQVDRLKVQFCQDLLQNVPNASVQVSQ